MAEKFSTLKIIRRKDALLVGATFYFTGNPCREGHLCERIVSSSTCRECTKISSRKRHQDNRPAALKRCRDRYQKKRESDLQYAADYYQKNKQVILSKSAVHKKKNVDRYREYQRKNWLKNRDRLLEINKAWYAANPDSKREYHSRRRTRKLKNGGDHTAVDVVDIFASQKGKCAYCRRALKGKYHVDHITPLSKGGSNDRKNLQILCVSCNLSKHARDPLVHARTLGLLL